MNSIRQATLDDVQSIHRLIEYLGYKKGTLDETYDRLKALIKSDHDEVKVFISEHDQSIVGWVHMFKALRLGSASFYELGGLVVNPDSRRQGVGKELVMACVDRARQENMSLRVRCNEVRSDTHAFYRQLQFSQTKTQFVFVAGTD